MSMKDVNWTKHQDGVDNCLSCWKDTADTCDCGGLIYNSFEDEDYDNVFLTYQCDKCRSTRSPDK